MRLSTYARALPALLAVCLGIGACGGNGEIMVKHDPFNGDQRAFALYLDPGHFTAVGMSEAKGKFALDVMVVQRGAAMLTGHAGDKGQFMVGGKMLEFTTAADSNPVASANRYSGVFTQWQLRYNLTPEQVAPFAEGPLTAVKVWVGEQWFQLELDPGSAKKFQSNLKIMSSAPGAPSAT